MHSISSQSACAAIRCTAACPGLGTTSEQWPGIVDASTVPAHEAEQAGHSLLSEQILKDSLPAGWASG